MEGEVWRRKIWFNPPFLWKCMYQVRAIKVFPVFRLLTDCLFVDLWVLPFPLKDCRCSVILLLPLLVNHNGISVPQMTTDTLQLLLELPVLFSFMTYHRLCYCEDMSSSSVLSGVRVARSPVFCMMLSVLQFKDYDYPSGGLEFIHGFKWGSCRSIPCLLYNVVCPSI